MTAGDVDYLLPGYDLDMGGISPAEVLGRGRNTDLIEDATVALAEARVRKSGVLEKLERWAAEDRDTDGMGGRPSIISYRAVLTALLLLARERAHAPFTSCTPAAGAPQPCVEGTARPPRTP